MLAVLNYLIFDHIISKMRNNYSCCSDLFSSASLGKFYLGSNIILTKKGAELAKKIKGKYCFFLLMLRYLGVKEENARIDACKMEHSVCDESYQALLDFFFHNHPDIIKQDDKGYKELFF